MKEAIVIVALVLLVAPVLAAVYVLRRLPRDLKDREDGA